MKRSLNNLLGYSVQTTDGSKGKVKDFLFDEQSWVIRYLDVDFGNLFESKRVLIPRDFLKIPDYEEKQFPIDLSSGKIGEGPDLSEELPVSREYEKQLYQHYGANAYWSFAFTAPGGASLFFPPRPMNVPDRDISEDELDTSLRSFIEVKDYKVRTEEDRFGKIKDFIVDDQDWQIVYCVVDTKGWQPWSKQVLISLDWLAKISYESKEVRMNVSSDVIKEAPEIKLGHPIDLSQERALYEYYSRMFVDKE